MTITVPLEASTAVVSANNLPAKFASVSYSFQAQDEAAFFAGYATRDGAAQDITPLL